MSILFRTEATQIRFEENKHIHTGDPCPLCVSTPLREFTFWKIIPNDFPYDRIAEVHHMIVPRRHSIEESLTPEESAEFVHIKRTVLLKEYDFLIETCASCKSQPAHFHVHLIVAKDRLTD